MNTIANICNSDRNFITSLVKLSWNSGLSVGDNFAEKKSQRNHIKVKIGSGTYHVQGFPQKQYLNDLHVARLERIFAGSTETSTKSCAPGGWSLARFIHSPETTMASITGSRTPLCLVTLLPPGHVTYFESATLSSPTSTRSFTTRTPQVRLIL